MVGQIVLEDWAGSVASLNRRLAASTYKEGEEIFEWLAKLDGIYANLKLRGQKYRTRKRSTGQWH